MEPIAIVGYAGRFPGAHDTEEFWANLREGREGLRTCTDEELLAAGVSPESLLDSNYVKVNGDAPDMDMFDEEFFGMTPREATICDPQLRMFLEIAHATVENAGYDPTAISDVGVFAATGHSLYMDHNLRLGDATSAGSRDMLAGVFNYPDYAATLVSYRLNFTGPSMTVLTACSSSLLTLHLALQALHNGECYLALAGGTEMEMMGHGYTWASGSPFSRDGQCRAFGAGATGTIFASGVGAVALKRLSDAQADGDHIRAVVLATAVNNDGADKVGFSAPGATGQTDVVMEALGVAEVVPESIGYVEAHGTGTPIGDPIEFAALTEAFRRSANGRSLPVGYCGLGSVKSGVGHLGHAAGVASLIKAVQCLERELLPRTLHVAEPNPSLELDSSPFYLVAENRPWPRSGQPRRACVHSLGFGGTNVHAVLEEAPVREPILRHQRPRLVVWSGRTEAAEQAYRDRLTGYFAECSEEAFADTVATLQVGRTAHPARAAAVCDSAASAAATLSGAAGRMIRGTGSPEPRPLAFLLPGQGSQHARMAAGLYRMEPTFTEAFDRCLDHLDDTGGALRRVWSAGTDDDLEDTGVAQQLLFAVEYSLAQMWGAWGIRPAALLGHSIGELVAATVAGVFPLPDAARLVSARAQAMADAPAGAMLAIRCAAADLTGLLPDGVTVVAANGPRQTVVGGMPEPVAAAAEILAAQGFSTRRVRTSHAFHTTLMESAADAFTQAFEGVTSAAPSVPVYSAATAAPLTADDAARPEFWTQQLVRPVLFDRALDSMLADREWTLLEVGPEQALSTLVRDRADVSAGRHPVLATLPRRSRERSEDLDSALAALGTLWTAGYPVTWSALAPNEPLRRLAVPGYPYQRHRHWVAPPTATAAGSRELSGTELQAQGVASDEEARPTEQAGPAKDAVPSAFSTVGWVERPLTRDAMRQPTWQDVPAVALLPADPDTSLHLMLALQQAGLRVVPVRPGAAYEDGGSEFRVRPASPEDLARVMRAMADRDRPVQLLVHAWGVGDWDEVDTQTVAWQLDHSFRSLFHLIQQGHRGVGARSAPGLVVLASRSIDVSGGEPVEPVKATLHGLVRTFAQEAPQQLCRFIDVGSRLGEDELATAIAAELAVVDGDALVALRRDHRWVSVERPYRLPPRQRPPLRRNGVYLVTGGLGGLGLAVAKGLARTGLRPKLALVGRAGSATDADLAEITTAGAEVRVFAGDVADERAMRRVVDTLTARFGPVNGVLHLAGVAGDGMLLMRQADAAERVLRPKVLGTLVLAELFASRPPLDFFVSFSSRAGSEGLVGGGDYAAANAFLDAYARTSTSDGGHMVSIGWPAWARVGMAARASASSSAQHPAVREAATQEAGRGWTRVVSEMDYPFLNEHRINGTAVMPGTGLLDLIVTAFQTEVPAEAPGAVQLREATIRQPLAVHGSGCLRIALEPAGTGWAFELWSAPLDGGEETLHVTGEVAWSSRSAPVVDLPALQERMTAHRPPPPFDGRVFTFGPRWNNIVQVSLLSEDDRSEKLVSLELPGDFLADLDSHPLHPALLDSAVSSARDPERDGIFVPFMYRLATVYERLPACFHSFIVRRAGTDGLILADIQLIAPDGRVLAEFEGFTMRRTTREHMRSADDVSAAGPADVSAARPEQDSQGIDPYAGVGLLLDLLGTPYPRQLTVRPFRDGQPELLDTVPQADRTLVVPLPAPPPQCGVLAPEPASVAPAPVEPSAGPAPAATATIEDRLRRIWAVALGRADIQADDDFFELGGNSLSALDLMALIRKDLGVELSVATLFDYPTFGALADALRTEGAV
jgi:phthiocerol/phenolphthiocerol synthesis type-I polyketide synthase E